MCSSDLRLAILVQSQADEIAVGQQSLGTLKFIASRGPLADERNLARIPPFFDQKAFSGLCGALSELRRHIEYVS